MQIAQELTERTEKVLASVVSVPSCSILPCIPWFTLLGMENFKSQVSLASLLAQGSLLPCDFSPACMRIPAFG